MSLTLDQAEKRGLFKDLVSKPADEIRGLAWDQLQSIKKSNNTDQRIQEIEYNLDNGDALKDSDNEEDRKLRRKAYAMAYLIGLDVIASHAKPFSDEDRDLFYRGSSFSKHYYSAALRLLKSFLLSFNYLSDEAWAEVKRIINPDNLWSLILVLAGWFLASIIGGYIGIAVNAILLAIGLYELWGQLKRIYSALRSWFVGSYRANSYDDLEKAGKDLAEGLSVVGVTALEIVITHKVFRFAESKISDRYPAPEWLKGEYDKAVELRDQRQARSKSPTEKPPEETVPDEKPPDEKPPDEKPPDEKPPDEEKAPEETQSKGKRKGGARKGIEAIGATRVAKELPSDSSWPWLLGAGFGLAALYYVAKGRR